MKKGKVTYSLFNKWSAFFMSVTLLWLTVSNPFVFASQQENIKYQQLTNVDTELPANEEESNPFGNSQEEKVPSGNSLTEEFLHEFHATTLFFSIASKSYKCHDAETYIAFHGELLVPPPNFS
ncbi:MAG: hypothetical protein IPM85_14075 [Chitinophagaceae bacterium]|nr:hypothetical protein [Chitinophagaceae bacterium]